MEDLEIYTSLATFLKYIPTAASKFKIGFLLAMAGELSKILQKKIISFRLNIA
jgi:hypothetical protein